MRTIVLQSMQWCCCVGLVGICVCTGGCALARADFAVEAIEQETVTAQLTKQFNLNADEVSTITEAAVEQADAATCLFEFTRTLNELASAQQKRNLLARVWRVAMADNALSQYEEHVIRKVADLLYLPHSDFIAAKQSAM